MRSWRARSLAGAALVVPALLASMLVPAGSPASAKWEGHLDLQWTLVRDHKLMTGPLAMAPHDRALVVVPRNDSRGFAVRMSSGAGGDLWVDKWAVADGPVRRLIPESAAVSGPDDLAIVAGHGYCRADPDELRRRGPIFIRAYSLSGQLRWTRWVGQCSSGTSRHRSRILSVSGADTGRNMVAISFTQGNSASPGVHRRRAHVAALTVDGDFLWRTTLRFSASAKEAVAHDVTANRHLVATSGEVVRRDTRWSFVVGLSPDTGALRWRDVVGGRIVDEATCRQSLGSAGRSLYVAGLGHAGRGILERRTVRGEVRWRAHVPPCVSVSALRRGGALWTGIAWGRARTPIVFGRHLVGGERGWLQEVPLPDGRWPSDPEFAARDRAAAGTADLVNRKTGNSSVYLWYWRWR